MPVQKYDWLAIYQDWLESQELEVKAFLMSNLGLTSKQASSTMYKSKTVGWRDKKKQYRQKIFDSIEKKTIENQKVQERVAKILEYSNMIENSVSYIINKKRKKVEINGEVVTVLDRDLSDMKDIKIAYEILRLASDRSTANLGGDKENPVSLESILSELKN
jgi:hypothetical protein